MDNRTELLVDGLTTIGGGLPWQVMVNKCTFGLDLSILVIMPGIHLLVREEWTSTYAPISYSVNSAWVW